MDIVFIESANGRRLSRDQEGRVLTVTGWVFGTGSAIEAETVLPKQGSAFMGTDFILNTAEIEERIDAKPDKIPMPQVGNSQTWPSSGKACFVTLTYRSPDKDQNIDEEESFEIDIGAREERIIRAPFGQEHLPGERDQPEDFRS